MIRVQKTFNDMDKLRSLNSVEVNLHNSPCIEIGLAAKVIPNGIEIDSELSDTSANAIQNQAITKKIRDVESAFGDEIRRLEDEPIQDLYVTKQDKLVSGTNIKTINGQSILGKGNIFIQGGGGAGDIDPELFEGFIPLSRDFSDDFNDDFAR